ncbi:MAG: hypothetical protein NTU94_09025 [Planctomycetota bacterium]|nr:hypothetical protein [Planctomycetota bacterium]
MSHPGTSEDLGDVAAVAKPAPGGTLAEYLAYEQAAGRPAFLSPDGTHAWIQESRGVLMRFPIEHAGLPDSGFLRYLLRRRGIWMASYLVEGTDSQPANCFDYVCRDPNHDLESMPAPVRRDIRRGLRRFRIRLCTWDEVADRGYPAEADTEVRHGHPRPSPEGVREFVRRRRAFPHFEVWGAWEGEDLAAWMCVAKVNRWALIENAPSRTESRRNCPNNALLYAATRRLLVEEGRAFVSNGRSSMLLGADNLPLHRYKTRMGYVPIPMCRAVAAHWLLGMLVRPKAISLAWDGLARLLPSSATVRRAASLSRVLSGRADLSLAWAQGDQGSR